MYGKKLKRKYGASSSSQLTGSSTKSRSAPPVTRDARPVRLVVAEQARVVGEAELLEQVGGVGPECERRRAVAARRRRRTSPRCVRSRAASARAPRRSGCRARSRGGSRGSRPRTPRAGDLAARVGVLVDDLSRHHEGGRDARACSSSAQDAREAGADVVVAARQRARRRQLERAAPERLGVEVDRERDRAPVAAPSTSSPSLTLMGLPQRAAKIRPAALDVGGGRPKRVGGAEDARFFPRRAR